MKNTKKFDLPEKELEAAVVERFLRYVKITTTSKDDQEQLPSTKEQFDLARLLEKELKDLGLVDVRLDENCYLYGTLPANGSDTSKVPVIGFISHVDTSPAVSGTNVKPLVHKNYQGGDIALTGTPDRKITVEKNALLKKAIGTDIISSDGTTLLGADDKAGIAEILTAMEFYQKHPEIPHGIIKVGFTPDEEVGRGADKFDVKGFQAQFAYTIDGEQEGELNDETFNAASATVTFSGKNTHPGYAKDIMVNSMDALAHFITSFRTHPRPETTEKRQGYIHPHEATGNEEKSVLRVILRDFEEKGLEEKKALITKMVAQTQKDFPKIKIDVTFKDSYRNMRVVLCKYPFLVEFAEEAMKRVGVTPLRHPIRGGTDGARLTFEGLPCANIFTGGQNAHNCEEWISSATMRKAVATIIHLVQVWYEKGQTLPS